MHRYLLFSALATHLEASKPSVTKRHQHFIESLEATGIHIVLGRFKPTTAFCSTCHKPVVRYEEKETDVAMSVKLVELCLNDHCDTVVLMTGDTDIAPAVRMVQKLCPTKLLLFAFPYKRKNKELLHLAPRSFSINKDQYRKFQLPNPCITSAGKRIHKPATW